MTDTKRNTIHDRLEYLRGEILAERISYGEISELQDLADEIDDGDMLLLEWAGVAEGTKADTPEPDPRNDLLATLADYLEETHGHQPTLGLGGGCAYCAAIEKARELTGQTA